MKGSIKQRAYTDANGRRKKCSTWSVKYSPPVRVGEARRHFTQSGFKTKREAEIWFDAKKAEFAQGVVTDGRKTLETYLNEWLAGLRRQSTTIGKPSLTTLHAYSNHVEQHIIPTIGSARLADLQERPELIEGAIHTWRTTPLKGRKKRNAGRLSESTVAHIFTTLRIALRKARKQRVLLVNPTELVDVPQRVQNERRSLTAEAAESLLDKVGDDLAVGAAITFLLGTGLRRGEVVALRHRDVDLKAKQVTVAHSLERDDGQSTLKQTKGEKLRKRPASKAEILPLGNLVLERLRRHLKDQAQRFAEAGIPITPETPLFDYAGGFWVPNTFGSAWMRALKKAGLEKLKLHELRHSFGGILRERGTDIKTIQTLMRHADYRTTANIYLHDDDRLNREAIERLDLALSGSNGKEKPKQRKRARGQYADSSSRIR